MTQQSFTYFAMGVICVLAFIGLLIMGNEVIQVKSTIDAVATVLNV